MLLLLVSPYFIDSYKNKISMGSAVKIARNFSTNHKVTVLTTGRKYDFEKINSNLEVISASGFLLPDPINYMISFSLLLKFNQLLNTYKPELVIVSKYMFFSSFVIPIAKIKGFKVITVTDTFPGINWFSTSKLTSVVMWLYARIIGIPLLKISDKVVLLYPGLEEIARKYRLNFVTIPNGVEAKYFKKLPKPKGIIKPKGEFWVGFVGRPESAKGYDIALEIAKQFKKSKKVKIVFVGGGVLPYREENKIYLGFRKDIMNIYQLFDCLILPSNAEGLPNVVMEAMSQGVPVIASGVGGVKYIINNEINGFLVSPNTVEFVNKIEFLKKDIQQRHKISQESIKTIKNNFNWQNILKNYQKLISNICVE